MPNSIFDTLTLPEAPTASPSAPRSVFDDPDLTPAPAPRATTAAPTFKLPSAPAPAPAPKMARSVFDDPDVVPDPTPTATPPAAHPVTATAPRSVFDELPDLAPPAGAAPTPYAPTTQPAPQAATPRVSIFDQLPSSPAPQPSAPAPAPVAAPQQPSGPETASDWAVSTYLDAVPRVPATTNEEQEYFRREQSQFLTKFPPSAKLLNTPGFREKLQQVVKAGPVTLTAGEALGQLPSKIAAGFQRTGAGLLDYAAQNAEALDALNATGSNSINFNPLEDVKGETPQAAQLRQAARQREAQLREPGTPAAKVVDVAGTTAANIAPALAAGAVAGPGAAMEVGALQATGAMKDRVWTRLKERGYSDEDAARLSSMAAGGAGAIAAATGGLLGGEGGEIAKSAARRFAEAGAEGAAYASLQAVGESALESAATGDKPNLLRIPEDATVGAAVNIGLRALAGIFGRGGPGVAPRAKRDFAERVKAAQSAADVQRIITEARDTFNAVNAESGTAPTTPLGRETSAPQRPLGSETSLAPERQAPAPRTPEPPGIVPHKVYTEAELNNMQGPALLRQAELWGVAADSRSLTIPRILDAQERWRLEQLTPKQLYDQVKGLGLRARDKAANIETLMQAQRGRVVQPRLSPQPPPGEAAQQQGPPAPLATGGPDASGAVEGAVRGARQAEAAPEAPQQEGGPRPDAAGSASRPRFTSVPREWIGRQLYDWGGAVMLPKGQQAPRDTGRPGRSMPSSFIQQLERVNRDSASLVDALREKTDEVWDVKGRAGGYVLAPKEAVAQATAELKARGVDPEAEALAAGRARDERRAKYQANKETRYNRIQGVAREVLNQYRAAHPDEFPKPNVPDPTITTALGWAKQQPQDSAAYLMGYLHERAKEDPKGTHYDWPTPAELTDGSEILIGREKLVVEHDPETGEVMLHDGVTMKPPPGLKIPAREVREGQLPEVAGDPFAEFPRAEQQPTEPLSASPPSTPDQDQGDAQKRQAEPRLATGTLAAGGASDLYGNPAFEAKPGAQELFGYGQDAEAAKRERAKTYAPEIERKQLEVPTGRTETDQKIAEQYDPTKTPEMFQQPGQEPGAGWKLHLATDDPEAVSRWLTENGLTHKVARSGGQEGKDVTVYVGHRDQASDAAARISRELGGVLKEPHGDTLADDTQMAPKVMGRFDVGRGDTEFHQYGSQGIPHLMSDVRNRTFGGNVPDAEARQRADEALRRKYGDLYTGTAEPLAATGPERTISEAAYRRWKVVQPATETTGATLESPDGARWATVRETATKEGTKAYVVRRVAEFNPAEPAGAKTGKDIAGFFGTMKGAVSDGYVDSMWQRVQKGEAIPRVGALENRLRDAQKAGMLKSREDVQKIVDVYKKSSGGKTPPTAGGDQPGQVLGFGRAGADKGGVAGTTGTVSDADRLALLRRAMPTAGIEPAPHGADVTLPNGKKFAVRLEDSIPLTPSQREYSIRAGTPPELANHPDAQITGMWVDADRAMRLGKIASQRTVDHETWHMAKQLADLSKTDVAALNSRFGGNEEAEAKAYAAWDWRTPNTAFGKVRTFFGQMFNTVFRPHQEVFRKVRGGEVFEPPKAAGAEESAGKVPPGGPVELGFGGSKRPAAGKGDTGPTRNAEIGEAVVGAGKGAEGGVVADTVGTVKDAAKVLRDGWDGLRKIFSPQTRSEQAGQAALVAREHGAELAQRVDRAEAAVREARKFFQSRAPGENYAFIDRMEHGRGQGDASMDRFAAQLRQMLDGRRDEVRRLGKGKLAHFIEDYFPHFWKDPEKAKDVFGGAKRPLEGPKSFLKQRTLPTLRDGLAAGLEPVSDNPVDLALLKVREMDRYILGQKMLAELKKSGLVHFIRATEKPPEGYARIDDNVATVYGPPTIKVAEHVDRSVYEGLLGVADALGIKHERKISAGRGRLGYSVQGGDQVVTQYATELSVLAHEIGHQLDHKYKLLDRFFNNPDDALRPQFKREMRAIADLTGRGRYARKRVEQIAQIVEAYVSARDRMKEVAPRVYREFERTLYENPELHPLRDVRPSLETTRLTNEKAHGGLLIMGRYHAPEPVATVLNNYTSPGLRGHAKFGGVFRAYQGAANVLNQAQLGASAFHLGFTSFDAAISKLAIGLERGVGAVRHAMREETRGQALGELGEAAKTAAMTPVAPATNLWTGRKMYREWMEPGSSGDPEMAVLVDAMKAAGGRVRLDRFYRTDHYEKMMEAFRKGNVAAGVLRVPVAVIEKLAAPIMEYVVPRQKLGVFSDLARFELEKLGPGATRQQVREAMAKAWDSVDNRMGQLVYDNLFWHKAAKDLGMASVRSLGWNIGTTREVFGGAGDFVREGANLVRGKSPHFTHRMAYVTSAAVLSGLVGGTLHYLMTGKHPEEYKDWFFPKTGRVDANGRPIRLNLPTYVKDVFHAGVSPGRTVINKFHPMIGLAAEMLSNEDFYGTQIRNPDDPLVRQALDLAKHAGASFEPFAVRGVRQLSEENVPAVEKALPFVGVTRAPRDLSLSGAEKLSEELARDKLPRGARTHEQADKAKLRRDLERGLRTNQPGALDKARQAAAAGQIDEHDLKTIQADAKLSPLQRNVKRLDAPSAAKVYEAATPQEREAIRDEVRDKIVRSDSLGADRQDRLLAKLGIEPPITLSIDRELSALRQRKRLYDDAVKTARERPMERADALRRVKANRLSATEQYRLSRLEDAHRAVQAETKRREAGQITPEEADRRIRKIAESAARRPAA